MSSCKECGWSEPGYSCGGEPAKWAYAPGCKLKLTDLSDEIMDALDDVDVPHRPSLDVAYDKIMASIESHFGVKF